MRGLNAKVLIINKKGTPQINEDASVSKKISNFSVNKKTSVGYPLYIFLYLPFLSLSFCSLPFCIYYLSDFNRRKAASQYLIIDYEFKYGKIFTVKNMSDYITEQLFLLQDKEYKEFHGRLMPTVSSDRIIGVRIPDLRRLAKRIIKEGRSGSFLKELPHFYYEENNLHAFIISEIKDFNILIAELERFIPYIDNWATCDSLRPVIFTENREALLPYALRWMKSEDEYVVRFGIEMMMLYYLDDEYYSDEYPRLIAEIRSDKYYVNMMIAWYFATALAKQTEAVMPYITEKRLSPWVHNKTIGKAVESYRISPEMKEKLRGYRIKNTD